MILLHMSAQKMNRQDRIYRMCSGKCMSKQCNDQMPSLPGSQCKEKKRVIVVRNNKAERNNYKVVFRAMTGHWSHKSNMALMIGLQREL